MRGILLTTVLCSLGFLLACSSPSQRRDVPPAQSGPLDVSLDQELTSILDIPADAKFQFNMDVVVRDKLLNLSPGKEMGGITSFEDLDDVTLEKLLRLRFADPRDRQNGSPSIAEFFRFMKRWPTVKAFGYAVIPTREDYRVSLEGLCAPAETASEQLRAEFARFCKGADELVTDRTLYAWWD